MTNAGIIHRETPKERENVALNTTGGFYEEFVINSDKYNAELQECIERTVERLRATETSAGKPGMLLGKSNPGKRGLSSELSLWRSRTTST
ncbi:hypothetical protein [Candidatus Amarobacter glycogenicus]|uniref:hypothetical protein n=1 Tax=Candidatus Amarobacter glycogenicus TaxID=3140699 RepID=UPI0031CCB02D